MSSFSFNEFSLKNDFYSLLLEAKAKVSNPLFQEIFHLDEEIFFFSLFQAFSPHEALSYKIRRRSLSLARFIINDKGDLDQEKLTLVLEIFEKEGFHLPYFSDNSSFESDRKIFEFLKLLNTPSSSLWKQIRKFDLPLCNEFAKKLIYHSLLLLPNAKIGKKEVRIAAIAAGLGYLRQNVGSCFATAPAILIHTEHLEDFYLDLHSILTLGKLRRVFGGIEYSVPLSPSVGSAPLKKRISDEGMLLLPPVLNALKALRMIPENLSFEDELNALSSLSKKETTDFSSLTYEEALILILEKNDKHELEDFSLAAAHFKATVEDPLLKIWEFTLASFSEVKMEFSNWNLYVSLGLNSEDHGGIGPIIYQFFKAHLDAANQKIEELHNEYIISVEQVRATEGLIAQSYSEDQIRRLKSELTARYYHMRTSLEMRQDAEALAKAYVNLYPFLINAYKEKFPEYFQEIYDPDLSEIKVGLFDDAPAGFRLVFKHGRTEATLWSKIETKEEYLEALISFFKQTEYGIARSYEPTDVLEIVHKITTEILLHLQKEDFIKSAFLRVKKNIRSKDEASFDKKPWAYISGGTLSTLIKTYYRREGEISMENRLIENPLDLLSFIVDTLKALSTRTTNFLVKNRDKKLLFHSPSHAFLLKPGVTPFFSSWQSNQFTYTWIRDEWLLPAKKFWQTLVLNAQELDFFISHFSSSFSEKLTLLPLGFPSYGKFSLKEILNSILQHLPHPSLKEPLIDHFNSFCHSFFPIVEKTNLKKSVLSLFPTPLQENAEKIFDTFSFHPPYFSAKEVREIAKALYIHLQQSVFISFDLSKQLYEKAQKENLAPLFSVVFADTNWPDYSFSFVLSPTTQELELWRTDSIGETGIPMSIWKEYLNGESKEFWTLYVDPMQWGG